MNNTTTNPEILALTRAIAVVESEIKKLEKESHLDKARKRLRDLILESGRTEHFIDNMKVMVSHRKGSIYLNREEAEKRLSPEVFKLVTKRGKDSYSLSIKKL